MSCVPHRLTPRLKIPDTVSTMSLASARSIEMVACSE